MWMTLKRVTKNGHKIENVYFWSHPKICEQKNERMDGEERTTTMLWIKLWSRCLKLSLVNVFRFIIIPHRAKMVCFYFSSFLTLADGLLSPHDVSAMRTFLHKSKFIHSDSCVKFSFCPFSRHCRWKISVRLNSAVHVIRIMQQCLFFWIFFQCFCVRLQRV